MTSTEVLKAAEGRTSKSGCVEITRSKPPLELKKRGGFGRVQVTAIVTSGEDEGNIRVDGHQGWTKAADFELP